ncbi:MAG: GPP34 family phosphoprotein [Planctomycetota bacterium]
MPERKGSLRLHEEVLLLALRDEEGTIAAGTLYQYAIGGAILAELLLERRVAVDGRKKNRKLVDGIDPTPLGAPILDECLQRISTARRRASLQTWVSRFASIKDLKHRVAGRLCERGILHEEEGKILLFFTRRIYPESDPRPERELIERLRRAIFTDSGDVDPRTGVLLSLANSASLLRVVFDRKELKGRKERIERIVNGELVGRATKEAIEAIHAAVMVACIVPVICASTTSG